MSVSDTQIVIPAIKHYSDFQVDWAAILPVLRDENCIVEPRSLRGEAPKSFVIVPASKDRIPSGSYIAKVGSKDYPNESIAEHLIGKIGLWLGVDTAESVLCIFANQVRFLSRWFLKDGEELTHGKQILESYLGEEYVRKVSDERIEKEKYTFDIVESAIRAAFPESADSLIESFVKMLTFDALVGIHDRHLENWGVIWDSDRGVLPRFSPLFDNARGLCWNMNEKQVTQLLTDTIMMNGYVRKSSPVLSWNGERLNHIELLTQLSDERPEYRPLIREIHSRASALIFEEILNGEFSSLTSQNRKQAIVKCLRSRHDSLASIVL